MDKFFCFYLPDHRLDILFPLVASISHILQGKNYAKHFSSKFLKKILAAIFFKKKLINFFSRQKMNEKNFLT